MKRAAVRRLLPALMIALTAAAVAADEGTSVRDGWLMMVATRCTEPTRETEFNAWYDDIDIPDVLEVPGYQRARRGARLDMPRPAPSAAQDQQGTYVALYDIESADIDKTIIEMLMATRKMEARGRSTDLLQVTERVYYRRLAPTAAVAAGPPSGRNEYLLVERVECCRDEAAERRFAEWYLDAHIPAVIRTEGFHRVTRYELYRVLMIEPKTASRFLTVYELEAESDEQAARQMRQVIERLREAGRASGWFEESGSAMYRKINDVQRR